MNNDSIYTITDVAESLISSDFENMNDWLLSLGEEELSKYYRMCSKRPEDRNGEEGYEICRYSIVLYCRELQLTELGLNSEFMKKITGAFCINIITEALRRQGMVEINGPLSIYKVNEIKLIKPKNNNS